MPVRRLLPLAAAAVAFTLASTGCADESAAAKVGDRTVSDADFRDELENVADSEALLALYGFGEEDAFKGQAQSSDGSEVGSYSQDFVAVVLNQRVTALMAAEILDREGIEINDQDRARVEQQLDLEFQNAGGSLSDLPEDYRDELVEGFTAQQKATEELAPEDLDRLVTELASQVKVNSRYGSWDTVQGVQPPEGPQSADGG